MRCSYSRSCESACGRGPTSDMSPVSTLNSCGISSMFQRRSQRPMRGRRGPLRRARGDDGAVFLRVHGAEFDDAKRLLIEAITALDEEDRPRTVELDKDGDGDE